ncbi:hypothetical protein FRC14_004490 [Serendipita sp. 396]|nr:hypothetical protein FRC14_004490 [Serendipita sp. 396]
MNGLLVGDEERMRLMETEREGRERELRKDLEASEYAAENPCAGGSSSAGSTSAGNGAMLNKQMQFNISEKSWYHSDVTQLLVIALFPIIFAISKLVPGVHPGAGSTEPWLEDTAVGPGSETGNHNDEAGEIRLLTRALQAVTR